MEQEMYNLKKAVFELEKSISVGSKADSVRAIEKILETCSILKQNINMDVKEAGVSAHIELIKINTIPFLYKPLKKGNYYDGKYLEDFGEERTEELKEAGAYNTHNEFWMQNMVIKGNVFGSVPKELLSYEAIECLMKRGWKNTLVNILEIKNKNVDKKEAAKYCENSFKHYILIRENLTNAFLILEYII